MPLIKDRQLIENSWRFVADDEPLPEAGNISVSLHRWLSEKPSLLQRAGQAGVRLISTEPVEAIAGDVTALGLIELDFQNYGDGRAFSQARILRDRYGYRGEIRAIGNFLADQVFYLHRVGVNAFDCKTEKDIALALAALDDFSVFYQASVNN